MNLLCIFLPFFVCGVCVCVCVCVCLAYTSDDLHMTIPRHTEDSTPSEDPKTGPRKHWLKTPKTSCFTILGGVSAPRTSMDFHPYLYKDIRVLGNISKASRNVCVCVRARSQQTLNRYCLHFLLFSNLIGKYQSLFISYSNIFYNFPNLHLLLLHSVFFSKP